MSSHFLFFFKRKGNNSSPDFSTLCNLHPADWLLMAPVDTRVVIIVFKSTQEHGDGAFFCPAANSLSRGDLRPRPFRQVTGRGLGLWQPWSSRVGKTAVTFCLVAFRKDFFESLLETSVIFKYSSTLDSDMRQI